jgi:outer membrane protein, adhesin transport system
MKLINKTWIVVASFCLAGVACAQSAVTVTDSSTGMTLVQAMRLALQRYPAVHATRFQLASAGSDVTRAEGARWPVLSVGAAAMQSGVNSTYAQSMTPQLTYSAYAGGGIEAGVDRAQHLKSAAARKLDSTQDDVAYQAGEAYLQWARAFDQLALARKNLQSVEQIKNDVETIVEVDKGRMVDLNQAQVRVKAAALIVSQREAEVAQAKAHLSRYVDMVPKSASGLDGLQAKSPPSLELALAALEEQHPVLEQMRAQVRAAQSAITIAQAQIRPKVDLSVARQINPYTLTTFTTSQVNLNMPVFNGGIGQAGVQGAVEQLQAAQSSLDEQVLVSQEKVSSAWSEWRMAQDRSSLSADQAEAGLQLVDNYKLQFKLARRSLLDLLNVQNETYGYQAADIQAGFDVRLAQLKLTSAMGRLVRVIQELP